MLTIAAVLFAVAALGGLVMAYIHFKHDRNPPGALAALHGIVGATALVILLIAVATTGAGGRAAWALGLFVAAALGGFYLVSFHVRKRRLPSQVVVIHALVAVVAFALLLAAIVGI
ncbi:MAG: hypothetical protein HY308_01565 [Gammaproteobacteria bacterium]|nr:hypothetical protein [Gammaproteobacteria bacterium]